MHKKLIILAFVILLLVLAINRGAPRLAFICDYFNSLWNRTFGREANVVSAQYNVGFTILDITGQERNFKAAVWYPTNSPTTNYTYLKGVVGSIALNSALSANKTSYPLVLFSHGAFSGSLQSTYLCQYLASQGYVVVAPDHKDGCLTVADPSQKGIRNCPSAPDDGSLLLFLPQRPEDMTALLDFLLDKPNLFYGKIDKGKIAAMGHSAGGTTVLALTGVNEKDVTKNYKDSRIKAAILLAPHVSFIETIAFSKMTTPSIYMWGQFDQGHLQDKSSLRAVAYDNSPQSKYLAVLKRATHFVFADYPTCLLYKDVRSCAAGDEQIKTLLYYNLTFLNAYLNNDLQSKVLLRKEKGALYDYKFAD